MAHGVISFEKLFSKNDSDEPIAVVSTFYGEEYTDRSAYLKFNNAIMRMGEPRDVDHTETDVEFVTRNEAGSLYAVVYHYQDGSVDSDMLVKVKNGGWMFHRFKLRIHPNFVSTYIPSIYGYKRLTESQIAQELAQFPVFPIKMTAMENYVFALFPGGIMIAKCAINNENEATSIEAIDFVPYESFARDEIKNIYQQLLHRYISAGNLNIDNFPEDLIRKTVENSFKRIKRKYGK